MRIFPAIDIYDGKCVRLRQGSLDKMTVYYDDPMVPAMKWRNAGAKILHIVDLDGAFTGEARNLDLTARIRKQTGLQVQVGGGVRNMKDIDERLDVLGLDYVVLGTAILNNPEMVEEASRKYPGRIVAGLDAKNGKVAIKGWVEVSDVTPVSLAVRMKQIGINTVLYTDILKDGMMVGPNYEGVQKLLQTGVRVLASGGVSSPEDLIKLKKTRVHGAIVGKALYDGTVDINDAMSIGGPQ